MTDIKRLYRYEVLALVKKFTDANDGQMTLDRLGPDTYPDPEKTSWNDTVSWRVKLTFGRGYFSGAVVQYTGRWASPRPDGSYEYNEASRDFPVDEAVDQFLSRVIPDWTTPAG